MSKLAVDLCFSSQASEAGIIFQRDKSFSNSLANKHRTS